MKRDYSYNGNGFNKIDFRIMPLAVFLKGVSKNIV